MNLAGGAAKMGDLVTVGIKMPDSDVLHVGTDPTPSTSVLDDATTPGPREAEPSGNQGAPGEIATGGWHCPGDMEAYQNGAPAVYDGIRASSVDVARIASHPENLTTTDGRILTAADIADVKSHLFTTEHQLHRPGEPPRIARFDADPFQADAWLRMERGEGTELDRLFLSHEFAEMTYLRDHPGSGYVEAHHYANTVADWWTAINRES